METHQWLGLQDLCICGRHLAGLGDGMLGQLMDGQLSELNARGSVSYLYMRLERVGGKSRARPLAGFRSEAFLSSAQPLAFLFRSPSSGPASMSQVQRDGRFLRC
jgi:hypothetical protein